MSDWRASPLHGKRVVLGVTGGIAAYKAAELARLFMKAGADLQVVMTRAAQEFIRPLTFQTLTGKPVATDLFDLTQESEIGHIKLATEADLVVIAPATADVIARLAAGMADDLLATLALVTRAPMLLAPAMNVEMWAHPFVQRNVETLAGLGRVHFIGPGSGWLACRMTGPGRLAEPEDVVEAAGRLLVAQDLAGRAVVVAAGPTREPLDPVRFLSNRSTGKMGYAIARAAAVRGARVTLVSGPTSLATPLGVERIDVVTACEMQAAVVERAPKSDVVVMTAAVADYRPEDAAPEKLKKEALGDAPKLSLTRNPDILADLGASRRGSRPYLVGFAAETSDVEARAKEKLAKKGCDLVVANDVSQTDAGFETDTNRVLLVARGADAERLDLASKLEVAHKIWDRVLSAIG